jgi:hypothetical protein
VKRAFKQQPKFLRESELRTIVTQMETFDALTVLQAFYREARNEFNQVRFIPAFINFFYVLEAMFSNGQSKKKLMMKEFEKSASLRNFAELLLNSPTMASGEHHTNLAAMLKHRQKNWDADGLLYLLVEIRGELLHHYAATTRKGYGTPFRNREYYTVALAVMFLATSAITEEMHILSAAAKARRAASPRVDKGA